MNDLDPLFGRLPVELCDSVLAFVTVPLDEYPFSVVFSPVRLNCDLWSLSRVCKSWHIVFGPQRERAKRLFRKILIDHTWCRFALENGEDTVALSVWFSLPDDYCDSPDDMHCAGLRESAHWQQFAASVKNLVRLELSNILCYHVPVVLEATARECPLIQVLGIDRMYVRDDESLMSWFDRFMDELRRALERWHLTTGGLRMLCIGGLLVYRLDVADMILEMVASHCPRIERLEATTYEGCTVQASIWQQFWCTCTEVREFEWRNLRWDAALCRAFATTQRPKFRTLCVDGADWAWVREDATLLTTLARALTNLRRLHLEGEPADVTSDNPLDELAQLLAVHCPSLVSVSVDS